MAEIDDGSLSAARVRWGRRERLVARLRFRPGEWGAWEVLVARREREIARRRELARRPGRVG
jgi:hypothetical protein